MSAVDEVKARLDIVDVVGGYVRLQKAGRYFKGLCPFHNEKTPSFIVYPDRQSWHCFGGCSTGGDVIAFMTRKENLDFAGALRLLADRAGVELRNDGPRREEIKTLQDANEAASLFFHSLLQNTGAAHSYIDERGLDREVVSDFQIGYSPPGWDGLKTHLLSRGFDEPKLVEAGLLIETDTGRTYDRFRDRVMFPIRDDRGRVVGFGGRVLPSSVVDGNDTGPKYMNTPQTPIFDKGSILYGLERAKEQIRGSGGAVIVEGYMDVIAAHQHGHRNVVASMGTALTDRQALLLQRFAERVVLAMDADEAGSAANLRGVQVVASATERAPVTGQSTSSGRAPSRKRLDIRVLALPQGKDPDELIRADPGAWTKAIEAARPVVDHLFAVVTAGRDLSQPQQRSDMVAEVLPTIGEIIDPVVQAHYLQRLSRLARVSEDALRRQLPRRSRGPRQQDERPLRAASFNQGGNASMTPKRAPREEFCLALLYSQSALSGQGRELDAELFSLSENRELFRRWQAGEAVAEDDAWLWEHYKDVLQTPTPQVDMGQAEKAFSSCVAGLEHSRMVSVKEASALALAEGEAGVQPGRIASIARARWEAGITTEARDESPEEAGASLLVEDARNSSRLHGTTIVKSDDGQVEKS